MAIQPGEIGWINVVGTNVSFMENLLLKARDRVELEQGGVVTDPWWQQWETELKNGPS